jgi:hypothetical protein
MRHSCSLPPPAAAGASPDGYVLPPHWRPVHDLILRNRLTLIVSAAASTYGSTSKPNNSSCV